MFNHSAATYLSTSGGSLTVMTTAGYFIGGYLYASGAGATLTVVDGTAILLSWSGAAGVAFMANPIMPIAASSGISVTNSGAGTYTIFYSKRV